MSAATQRARQPSHFDSDVGDLHRPVAIHAESVRCLLPDFDQVSVSVLDEWGRYSTTASTGHVARDLDRLQYSMAEGPCIDSLREASVVVAPHLRHERRWLHYVPSAAELGVRSQLVVPLRTRDGRPMGVLNLYSTTAEDVPLLAPKVAEAIAGLVAEALISAREIENLHRAMASREVIGIAIGVIMERHGLSRWAAFALLRRQSNRQNVKLRVVADRLVADPAPTGGELPPAAAS